MPVGKGVWYPKTRTSECLQIDMAYLNKHFDLEKEHSATMSWTGSFGKRDRVCIRIEPPGFIRLIYTITKKSGEKIDMNYRVYMDMTECNLGGIRYWFVCPICQRRCRVIYLPPGGHRFTCRICNNLTYASTQEGYPRWKAIQEATFMLPKWERQYFRARSDKKRQRLLKKMRRVESGLKAFIAWSKRVLRE